MTNKPKVNPLLQLLKFFIIGFLVLTTLTSGFLYVSVHLLGFDIFHSWWATWLFTLIIMMGTPLTLIVDGIMESIYTAIGHPKVKKVFVFISKVLECSLLVFIVYQADEWIKGVSCSTMFEAVIGYIFFLGLEGIFALGKKLQLAHMKNHQKRM